MSSCCVAGRLNPAGWTVSSFTDRFVGLFTCRPAPEQQFCRVAVDYRTLGLAAGDGFVSAERQCACVSDESGAAADLTDCDDGAMPSAETVRLVRLSNCLHYVNYWHSGRDFGRYEGARKGEQHQFIAVS